VTSQHVRRLHLVTQCVSGCGKENTGACSGCRRTHDGDAFEAHWPQHFCCPFG
jgi:predicted Fe-S protein YdhL (DUF1289 family)